ncbi:MAG: glycine dehydrogenase (aminomethyl-transferring) [Phycisphaerales bacterium]|nr:glycine dehydrogenase (aminomethyl-transferring) [Phycisphaerales bacterium]
MSTMQVPPTSAKSADCASLSPTDTFANRHLGLSAADVTAMLKSIGCSSMEQLIDSTVPASIRRSAPLILKDSTNGAQFAERGESETLASLRIIAERNEVWRTYLGMGYFGTITPGVIQRNILECPGWYTAYTPYQAEIAQGRMEALLNFQTVICELTGLALAGASLLDEGTAAAEAMTMCINIMASAPDAASRRRFFVSHHCNPQTIAVVRTRADGLGIEVVVGDPAQARAAELCGLLLAYPNTDGTIEDFRATASTAHAAGAQVVAVCDPLALVILASPASWGADIAVGSSQRFGVPLGMGGPHAGFIATRLEHARRMPGRIIGVSKDAQGNPALRMAIQTREQHIRRERATSNICTAQVLLAVMAGMYAVYHGPSGLQRIARRVHQATNTLAAMLREQGHLIENGAWFDTIRVRPVGVALSTIVASAAKQRINLRSFADGTIGIALDETVLPADLQDLALCFGAADAGAVLQHAAAPSPLSKSQLRSGAFLEQPVFNLHHSETDMLRYIKRLEAKDLSLCHSMIALGSCTMKLNATSEMIPVSWPEFGQIHPFAPAAQWRGYREMFAQLEAWLCEITGFAACSLQPNAGSQGEFAGLMAIRARHTARKQNNRNVCLIPDSAHGTNPASAVVAGLRVVPVACLENGDVDINDLRARAQEHSHDLAALMVTYPSTRGVFEEGIREICQIVHEAGGLVYMDGANMNAQVGLTSPGEIGADICHLNLHKTFCIPHGGGGPGVGPICCTAELAPYLPGNPVCAPVGTGEHAIGAVSSAPYGSASILLISWMYIAMMGHSGLTRATQVAILNANYMAGRLKDHYPVLFTNQHGRCAHEFIIDCRAFDRSAGIKIDDIAKRLIDYGFHAPTMSFPVPGTLMIEPTESESLAECNRFCDALISIREEIRSIETGIASREDNPLKHAPHTAAMVSSDNWSHPYSREQAAYPAPWLREFKFWPAVARVDNPYGDRNLVCSCEGVKAYA